jgi:alkanesulfonate monooxygenase
MTQPVSNSSSGIKIFSTAPQSREVERDLYLPKLVEIAQWSEHAGFEGILVYTDNSLVDPWLVSQIIIQNTTKLCPLVAIQSVYMHPYTVAKMIASLGHVYRRRIYLNMVAGGFKNDLLALNDTTPHDKRYARLVEYTTIIQELLRSPGPVSYHGEFYTVDKLRMTPALDEDLFPGVLVSGSSEAGMAAAAALGAIAVKYPQASDQEAAAAKPVVDSGIRVGIIVRENSEDAWNIAHARFPGDRKGQLTHQLAMKTSDSQWHKQLSQLAEQSKSNGSPYWLWPFENYNTFCPYLVGKYDDVAAEVSKYIAQGFRTFILDIPQSADELHHINLAFNRAQQMVSK